MPGRGSDRRTVRIKPRDWDKLGRLADEYGIPRATLMRELTRWWMGEIPEPPPGPWQTPTE